MPWFSTPPTPSKIETPNYGAAQSHAIDHNGSEVIPAGTSSRYMSVSVAVDAARIYVNYGAAVDVANEGYVYVLPPDLQHHRLEIPAQAIHMATESAGKTASINIAVAE